jgi:peptidoglycan/LPS O-acetylase OafA/YrhL
MSLSKEQTQGRLFGMDLIRVLALLGVVLYHTAAAYSTNTPYWSVHDGTSAIATGIRELLDVFIMPIFFFLAGYFTLSSLRKRGYWSFFKSKFWELGYVWLIAILVVLPAVWYYENSKASGSSAGFLHSWLAWMGGIGQTTLGVATSTGQMVHMHFWFVSLLFYFFVVFILLHMAWKKLTAASHNTTKSQSPKRENVWLTLAIFGLVTTVGYYLSLLLIPDTSWLNVKLFLQLQPAKLFLYAAYFGLGLYGSSRNWFVDGKLLGPLSIWAPATVLLGTVFLVVGQSAFLNPATTKSLSTGYLGLFALVRSFFLLSVLVTLSSFAMRYFNRPNRAVHTLADNSYYIYLIHAFVVSMFQDILMIWPTGPALVKILAVFAISVPLSYALSRWVFRKLTIRDWVRRKFLRTALHEPLGIGSSAK